MEYETIRIACEVDHDVAHLTFKSADVVEYTEAANLTAELRHCVDSFEFRVFVVDCAALTFVTSTVLEAFVSVYLRCRRKGRLMRIVNTTALVRDMLVTTRLDRIIEICDTMADAMRIDED